MNIVDPAIESYCIEHSQPVDPVLYQLERETYLKTLAPQMLSGQLQGHFLQMICRMVNPKRILEVGTFTGYSAISMAMGSPGDVQIDTIEANGEFERMIRKYLGAAGVGNRVRLHIGDALETIPFLDGPYDIAFIDAAKTDYPSYFELVIGKMRPGGFILSDNVLWAGKVLEDEDDAETRTLREYNKMLKNDPRIQVLMLPVRDGISIARVI